MTNHDRGEEIILAGSIVAQDINTRHDDDEYVGLVDEEETTSARCDPR